MPREAYSDRRRYDDGGDGYSSRRGGERYGEEGRRHDGARRTEDRRGRDEGHRRGEGPSGSGPSHGSTLARRRSRSPDFERDRRSERRAYDRRHSSHQGGGDQDRGPDEGSESAQQGAASMEPNFEASGLLAKESNSKNGVALKYAEPPEARKSKKKWRLYVFKDGKEVDVLHISRQSCYLMGRDRAVADIPIEHPSISKQHAVIQFRSIHERNEYGDEKHSVKPFLIDLDSANGCLINDAEVPPSRYYEMRNGDTLKLGGSQREYVLLLEE